MQLRFLCEQARSTWIPYRDYWVANHGWEFNAQTSVIASEERFEFTHALPDGRSIKLYGYCDGVLSLGKEVALLENKTKSRIDDKLANYIPYDLQTGIYQLAIRQQYGVEANKILYNVIRKPELRQKPGESNESFIERYEKDLAERPEHYFKRLNILLRPKDLDKWIINVLNPIIGSVLDWWEEISVSPFDPWQIPNRKHHFMNPLGLYTQYGRCNYFDYLTTGNDFGLTKREREFGKTPRAKKGRK